MDKNLVTLIAAIIAGSVSFINVIITGVFGVLTSIKVSKIENIESHKKFNRNITNFELQFKDERWLAGIIERDEFGYYNEKSQKRIYNWWVEYKKIHPPILLKAEVDYDILTHPPVGRIRWKSKAEMLKQIKAEGESCNMIMPGDDDLPDPADLF